MVRQTALAQHLSDNGIPAPRVNETMRVLMREMAPLNMQEMVGGVRRTASQIRAKAAQTQTGHGIGAERNRSPYPDAINIQRLDNPAGLPEDFPRAFIPADADADYKGFIRLENQRLGQVVSRLAQIEGRPLVNPVRNPLLSPSADLPSMRPTVNPVDQSRPITADGTIPRPTPNTVNPTSGDPRVSATRIEHLMRVRGITKEAATVVESARVAGVPVGYREAGNTVPRIPVSQYPFERVGYRMAPSDYKLPPEEYTVRHVVTRASKTDKQQMLEAIEDYNDMVWSNTVDDAARIESKNWQLDQSTLIDPSTLRKLTVGGESTYVADGLDNQVLFVKNEDGGILAVPNEVIDDFVDHDEAGNYFTRPLKLNKQSREEARKRLGRNWFPDTAEPPAPEAARYTPVPDLAGTPPGVVTARDVFPQNRVVDTSNAATGTPTGAPPVIRSAGDTVTPRVAESATNLPGAPDPYYRGVDSIPRDPGTPTNPAPGGFVQGGKPQGSLGDEAAALRAELAEIQANRLTRNDVNVGQAADLSKAEHDKLLKEMEQDASILGQLYDPMTSLGEGAEYLKRHMPVKQFLLDTYTVARRGDYIKKHDPQNPVIPEGYVKMPDKPEYGPFAGTVTHRQISNEVENALFSDAEGRMSALGRINSAVSGGYLASPSSIANNFIGGLYVGHLYGSNPVDVINELRGVLADAKKLKGRENLSDMDDIGHLMGAQSKALALAQMIDGGKLDISGISDPQMMQKLSRWYGDVLKKPLGQGWAGLDWFQATEDVLKLSNYRLALKKFGGDKAKAVEYTRNVVFDYSKLPEATRQLRDHGLMTFPGFPMFMASRTMRTVINTPGRIMPYERLPEAVWNATMDDEETQYALAAGLHQWQFDAKAIPISVREGIGGHVMTMMNFGAYAPTGALDRNNLAAPFTESLGTFGMARPILDVALAAGFTRGEAPFSARYGQQVFRPGQSTSEKVRDSLLFLGQQYAPAGVRKAFNYNPGRVDPDDALGMQGPLGGVLPSVWRGVRPLAEEGAREVWTQTGLDEAAPGLTDFVNRNVFPMDAEMAEALRQFQEGTRKKREKTAFDNAASMFLPGVSAVSLEPGIGNVERKKYGYEVRRADEKSEQRIEFMRELQRAARGQATEEDVMAIIERGRSIGIESVTLPSGEVIPLTPRAFDIIATLNYQKKYEEEHPGQGVR